MPPEEIQAQHESITHQQANELAAQLATLLPEHKQIEKFAKDCKRDGATPAHTVRMLLGSAYDWFRFGN